MRRRTNPMLITLTNPGRKRGRRNPAATSAEKAWSKFHGASAEKANVIKVPDVPGLPSGVMSLGLLDQLEFSPRGTLSFGRNYADGPWLVTDAGMRKLWIVARKAARLSSLKSHLGDRVVAASYFPENAASEKWDGKSAFRHAFGDGGPLPEDRWRETWPRLDSVGGGKAWTLARGKFHLDGKWIIG